MEAQSVGTGLWPGAGSVGQEGGKDGNGIGAQETQKIFSSLWDHNDKSLPSLPGVE